MQASAQLQDMERLPQGPYRLANRSFCQAAGACEESSKTPPAFVWRNQAASARGEFTQHRFDRGSKPATVAIARIANELIRSGQILELKDLAIDGHDLLECGYEGKEIGQMLELILRKYVSKVCLIRARAYCIISTINETNKYGTDGWSRAISTIRATTD